MDISKLKLITLTLAIFAGVSSVAIAQVGIGTVNPEVSSMLDISSTDKGMLAPRMTSVQRIAISSPANGLLVYDTTENAFYFYKSSVWSKIDSAKRSMHKLIQSEADLAAELVAGGGSTYLLSSDTLYEINGTIALLHPIDLNNAYIVGFDTNEDVLSKAGGTMFVGSTGGSIKGISLTAPGGTIFALSGANTQNLIFRDAVVYGSGSIGTVSGFGLAFVSIVQFVGNGAGIIYNNITNLLLSNMGWLSSNSGTYETFTGTFNIIQKQGGFSEVNGSAIGIDVSSNPAVSNGVLTGVSFSGTSTQYIKRYGSGSYAGFNFNNAWTVDCPGIPVESDQVATG
ncbi:MAG: hypothetical protein WBC43_09720, partial [Olleya sp.]